MCSRHNYTLLRPTLYVELQALKTVLSNVELLGVDVGFSKVQKSTGIAFVRGDDLTVYRANSTEVDRKRLIPEGFSPSVTAFDGPLIPTGADPLTVRLCEKFFSRGLFSRRCKPGLSHFGTGLALREATTEASRQFSVYKSHTIEAFPNLFLGVMVREEDYNRIPALRRGQKFDWLYDHAYEKIMFLRGYMKLPEHVFKRIVAEKDHEMRAALICLLTAALEDAGTAIKAGNDDGGWFWLPPIELWEKWALNAASHNLDEMAEGTGIQPVRVLPRLLPSKQMP